MEYGSALVTLVEIRSGAARALGAQMAVRGDGGYCGYVSGGCTEAAVFRHYPPMRWRHHTGNPCRQGRGATSSNLGRAPKAQEDRSPL